MLPIIMHPQPVSSQLYRLTIGLKDVRSHVYCMSTSVDEAFTRYLGRMQNRHESIQGVVLIHGELADPNRPKARSGNNPDRD